MNPESKVTLMTATRLPLETVWAIWDASKTNGPLRTPDWVRDHVPAREVEELFRAVIAQHIPVGEMVDFVFMIENVSISWREQAVRHRIGVKISPERIGIDMVPDLADSSFWSQSMRILNMSNFADEGGYRLPRTVKDHKNPDVQQRFQAVMKVQQDEYAWLVEQGIPMEDARELIGLGAHHRISWKLNMGALQHIVGKRGCWILQLGIWGPVIQGMISELVEHVHPIFAEVVSPPCLKGDEFTGCIYQEEVRRRYTGDDKLPPCPLHLYHHGVTVKDENSPTHFHVDGARAMGLLQADDLRIPMVSEMQERAEEYRQFWNRDPYTGIRK